MGRPKKKVDTEFGLDTDTEVEANIETEPEKKEPATVTVIQTHLCSWCGGYQEPVEVKEGEKVPPFVDGQRVPFKDLNKRTAKTKLLHVCGKCLFRVYNNVLGKANYIGKERQKWGVE